MVIYISSYKSFVIEFDRKLRGVGCGSWYGGVECFLFILQID